MRRWVALAIVVLGAGCLNSTEPRGFIFQYEIGALACATDCTAPGDSAITTASRGDTVWVFHTLTLIAAIDSFKTQTATVRPPCAENVVLQRGTTTAGKLPSPLTCPDSTAAERFTLVGFPDPSQITRYTRWIVDSSLVTGSYGLRGRVMVQPRIEPIYSVTVQ